MEDERTGRLAMTRSLEAGRGKRLASRADERATIDDSVARGLGVMSLALGLGEIVAPGPLARLVGIAPRPLLLRLLGLREVASGVALLWRQDKTIPLWGRVAGDVVDLAFLGAAALDARSDRTRVAVAMGAIAGIAAVDATMAVRSGSPVPRARVRVVRSIAVRREPADCYAFWRELRNVPRFMTRLESVTEEGDRSRWRARVLGRTLEWDAEITRDEPGFLFSWRSLEGGDLATEGVAEFQSKRGGTMVRVALELEPRGASLQRIGASLIGDEPGAQLRADLRRFKQLLETGEIATVEGQPSGSRSTLGRALETLFQGGES